MNFRRVAIIVPYTGNKILIQNREGHSKVGEKYGFFGGGIEEGESIEEALVRETQEELGIAPEDYRKIGEWTLDVSDNLRVEHHVFIWEFDGDLSKLNLQEGKEMELIEIDDARCIGFPPNTEVILDKLKEVLG